MKKADAIQQIASAMERRDAALLESLHDQARGRDVATVTAIPRDYKSLAEAKFKEAQTKRAFDDVMARLATGPEPAPKMPPWQTPTMPPLGYVWADAQHDFNQLLSLGWTLDALVQQGILRRVSV